MQNSGQQIATGGGQASTPRGPFVQSELQILWLSVRGEISHGRNKPNNYQIVPETKSIQTPPFGSEVCADKSWWFSIPTLLCGTGHPSDKAGHQTYLLAIHIGAESINSFTLDSTSHWPTHGDTDGYENRSLLRTV